MCCQTPEDVHKKAQSFVNLHNELTPNTLQVQASPKRRFKWENTGQEQLYDPRCVLLLSWQLLCPLVATCTAARLLQQLVHCLVLFLLSAFMSGHSDSVVNVVWLNSTTKTSTSIKSIIPRKSEHVAMGGAESSDPKTSKKYSTGSRIKQTEKGRDRN